MPKQARPAASKATADGKKPARTETELARMLAACGRVQKRHQPVAASLKVTPDGASLGAPHDDGQGWRIRLADAFGSASDDFAMTEIRRLINMSNPDHPSAERNLNAMLAVVDSVRPESEIEGQLAVQMAATHHLAMDCLARAAKAPTIPLMEAAGNLATKMLRTYAAQTEALEKLRRRGTQTVRVEHVHVYQGGQAIVGNVNAPNPGGLLENGPQPHATDARALSLAPSAPVLCQDPAGAGVPVPGSVGQAPVPDARRRERKRGAAR